MIDQKKYIRLIETYSKAYPIFKKEYRIVIQSEKRSGAVPKDYY